MSSEKLMFLHLNRRLKHVSMSLLPFILRDDSLTKILNYKFWRSLRIAYPSQPDMTVITRLLSENPLLEKLSVQIFVTSSTIPDFSNFFKVLVKSRLKSLVIQMADYAWPLETVEFFIAAVTSSLEGLQCNDTVEYLSVSSELNAEFCSLFVKYFRNIRYLEAKPGNVNAIFKYQTNLKSLLIQPLPAIRTDEPPARTSIESLELIDIRPLASSDVFATYRFPNLKYLLVNETKYFYDTIRQYEGGEDLIGPADLNVIEENGGHAIAQNDFEELTDTFIFIRRINNLMLSIFRKSPLLEAIHFDSDYNLDADAFNVFFQSCRHFHQLRYVSFYCDSSQIDEMTLKSEVVKYFKKCPSFRGLWLKTLRFQVPFYFNTVTKEYEFSQEFSDGNFGLHFAADLPDFWRYKR